MAKVVEAKIEKKAEELLTKPVLKMHNPAESMRNIGNAIRNTPDFGNVHEMDKKLGLTKKFGGLNQDVPGEFLKILENLE